MFVNDFVCVCMYVLEVESFVLELCACDGEPFDGDKGVEVGVHGACAHVLWFTECGEDFAFVFGVVFLFFASCLVEMS